MKYFILILLVFFLAGCDTDVKMRSLAEKEINQSANVCIDGITYIIYHQGYRGYMSVKLDRYSKVIPCR